MKRNKLILLTALLLCVAVFLGACGEEPTPSQTTTVPSGEATYQVTVVDAAGNPYTSGVIVRFLKNGEQAAMQPVNETGVAEKTLETGDYTVELVFTGDENAYYYDEKSDLTLSGDKTALTVILNSNLTAEPVALYVGGNQCQAYPISIGGTYVPLTAGQRGYFLFTPTEAGKYQFMADGSVQIGYYGSPHFVQDQSAAEVADNAFTISVKASMLGNTFVIGIDSDAAENCVLTITRLGEPDHTIEDEPWVVYAATVNLAPYTLPSGTNLVTFDLTKDSYDLVLNANDGFYHMNTADGPLVYVHLRDANCYLDSFKTILDYTGVNRYFFDEDGNFLKKESYTECLMEYLECMDEETGVYPLTEDLKYIIQQEGADSGWFDPENSMYLFVDEAGNQISGINQEIAWLFMCCYAA